MLKIETITNTLVALGFKTLSFSYAENKKMTKIIVAMLKNCGIFEKYTSKQFVIYTSSNFCKSSLFIICLLMKLKANI